MRALLRRKGVTNWPHVHGHGHQFERVQIVLFFVCFVLRFACLGQTTLLYCIVALYCII